MKRILFVCTGNTCRSPMAEGMLRLLAEQAGIELEVRSAGVSAYEGAPMSGNSAAVLREKGYSGNIVSSSLNGQLIEWADLVLTMTSGHKRHAALQFPGAADKLYTLKEFVEDDDATKQRLDELTRLAADLQLKQALSQRITEEDRARIAALERQLPVYDIADPYGGSLAVYKACAAEIEAALHKLLRRLADER